MRSGGSFHRWDGEYLTRGDWPNAPTVRDRVRHALGPVPLQNARHLLTPLPEALVPPPPTNAVTGFERLTPDDQFALRLRLARSIELRLMARGRRFPSRDVWRAAYALGLLWGNMDVFHWYGPAQPSPARESRRALFTLSALGDPVYFLPERAAEGETIAGLTLSFELPPCPDPLAVYDRLAVALGYLRQQFGGHPVTADGAELDHDHLYADRDTIADTVREMVGLGIPPGSDAAGRLV